MKNFCLLFLALSLILGSCSERKTYTPKPRGYFRIDFPQKAYQQFDTAICPFTFSYPKYGVLERDTDRNAEPFWYNLQFKNLKATIHLSYRTGTSEEIKKCLEDARELAYKHTVKADAIDEKAFVDSANKVFGLVYEIRGNAASPFQFFLTDSCSHFMRGALYFNVAPNKDSLAPAIDFLQSDMIHLIESVRWKTAAKK